MMFNVHFQDLELLPFRRPLSVCRSGIGESRQSSSSVCEFYGGLAHRSRDACVPTAWFYADIGRAFGRLSNPPPSKRWLLKCKSHKLPKPILGSSHLASFLVCLTHNCRFHSIQSGKVVPRLTCTQHSAHLTLFTLQLLGLQKTSASICTSKIDVWCS